MKVFDILTHPNSHTGRLINTGTKNKLQIFLSIFFRFSTHYNFFLNFSPSNGSLTVPFCSARLIITLTSASLRIHRGNNNEVITQGL